MKEIINEIAIQYTLILIAGLAVLFLIGKLSLTLINDKRLKGFTLDSKDTDIISFGDLIKNLFNKIVKQISNRIKNITFIKKYSLSFDKYLIYDEKSIYNSLDIISMKIIFMILSDILYVVAIIFKLAKLDVMLLLLTSIIGFFIIDIFVILIYKKTKSLLEEQLLQSIVIMNNAFKSGKNIMQAVKIVENELPNPIKNEFAIISKDISFGLDLTTVFERFAKRVKIPEAKYITSSLSLLNKTGGNIVTVFNMIERTFYDRLKIKNELRSLTSASRFLYKMLLAMPPIFVFIIIIFNPVFFNPLISTTFGFIIDALIVVLYVVYIITVKKIVRVDEV